MSFAILNIEIKYIIKSKGQKGDTHGRTMFNRNS